jgi:hypothetical protein
MISYGKPSKYEGGARTSKMHCCASSRTQINHGLSLRDRILSNTDSIEGNDCDAQS